MIHHDVPHQKNPAPKTRAISSAYALTAFQYSKPIIFMDAIILLSIFALPTKSRINKAAVWPAWPDAVSGIAVRGFLLRSRNSPYGVLYADRP
jgi:hypothetical protein